MAESVIDCYDCGILDGNLAAIVRSLGLPEVNSEVITTIYLGTMPFTKPNSYQFVRNLVGSLKKPKSLLIALKQALEMDPLFLEGKLQPKEATVVLEYFSRNVQSLRDVDKEILKKLPFYPTARGGLAKLEDTKSCIIPDELPEEEMDVVESELNCLFLKSTSSLSHLYEFLHVESVSPVEAYLDFVFKCFPYFSEEGTLAHIKYISQFNYSGSAKQKNEREIGKQTLLDYLKKVNFIPNKEGTLMTASNFYDPRNLVFKSMLTEDEFPPEPFASEEWLSSLEMIGLVQDVSHDDFERFATEVAHEAATKRNKNTYTKSRVLVNHLISRHNVVGDGLLHMVCDIPFVAAHPVTEQLLTVCPPLGETMDGGVPFIAFKGAVFNDYEDIVWTKAHLLPEWADPRSRQHFFDRPHGVNIKQYCNTFLAQLQIVKKPSVNLVVTHCENICTHFERKTKMETASPKECSVVMTVMESIYAFLQDNATTGNEAKKLLETSRCIVVEEGRRFILPSQAVLELYESGEIKPYLYRIPPEFGKFQRFFEYLGCSKAAGATHYAMVLEMLWEGCQDDKLHQNEVRTCSKAVKGFFARLQDDPGEASEICNLYLPATFAEHLYLPETFSEIRFFDKPLKNIPVTLHKSAELVFNDIPAYGPRIASLNIRFVLELSLMDVTPKSVMTNYEEVMKKLPAPLQPVMLSSVVREKLTDGAIVTNEAVNVLMARLSSVQFVRGIIRIIRDVDSQKKQINEGIAADIENGLRNIELCAVESLKTSLFYIGQLISGSEKDVPYFQEKVVLSGKKKLRVYFPSLTGMSGAISAVCQVIEEIYGDCLGKKMVLISEMLRCPLGDIWPLLDSRRIRRDDTCHGTEINIYAEPGGFIPVEDHFLLNNAFFEFEPGEYVGYQLHDPSLQLEQEVVPFIYAVIIKEVEVIDEDATKMYLINIGSDKEPIEVNAAVLYKFHRKQDISERDEEGPRNRNKEVISEQILELVEDALRLPKEQRRQVLKRIIQNWFPDEKDEEFCLEEELPRFCIRKPEEAKRWFRQAEADLAAGANEIYSSRPSYEWVCFKCHQASEKALKAVQYTIDAARKTSDHNLVHNCYRLNDPELISLARDLESLVGSSARMRYPDQVRSDGKIPNEVYSAEMAEQALQLSENIVMRVKDKIYPKGVTSA